MKVLISILLGLLVVGCGKGDGHSHPHDHDHGGDASVTMARNVGLMDSRQNGYDHRAGTINLNFKKHAQVRLRVHRFVIRRGLRVKNLFIGQVLKVLSK